MTKMDASVSAELVDDRVRKMTVPELKSALRTLGRSRAGVKADLVARLLEVGWREGGGGGGMALKERGLGLVRLRADFAARMLEVNWREGQGEAGVTLKERYGPGEIERGPCREDARGKLARGGGVEWH